MSEVRQTLKIRNYEVWVNLGCSAEEQKQIQPVQFTFEIKFLKNLSGSKTDHLADAVDYVRLTEIIKAHATKKNYHLIEHMNHEVFHHLIETLEQKKICAELILTLKKVRVPVENLVDGVEFTCQQMLS